MIRISSSRNPNGRYTCSWSSLIDIFSKAAMAPQRRELVVKVAIETFTKWAESLDLGLAAVALTIFGHHLEQRSDSLVRLSHASSCAKWQRSAAGLTVATQTLQRTWLAVPRATTLDPPSVGRAASSTRRKSVGRHAPAPGRETPAATYESRGCGTSASRTSLRVWTAMVV